MLTIKEVGSITFASLCVFGAYLLGAAQKECNAPAMGKYYQVLPPTAAPAVNLVSCSKESLRGSLEHLRVCRSRHISEQTK